MSRIVFTTVDDADADDDEGGPPIYSSSSWGATQRLICFRILLWISVSSPGIQNRTFLGLAVAVVVVVAINGKSATLVGDDVEDANETTDEGDDTDLFFAPIVF